MLSKLHTNTTSPTLLHILNELSSWKELNEFRLVGGTALSLQLGHRVSVDIDLFSDALYGSIDFVLIYNRLVETFPCIMGDKPDNKGFGVSYKVGQSSQDCIRIDLFYTDPFLFPPVEINNLRIADVRDIAIMKLEVISNAGRKKDFWDISEILESITFDTLLELYQQKYPYFDIKTVIDQMTNFQVADEMDDPDCLMSKSWDFIKLDLEEMISKGNYRK